MCINQVFDLFTKGETRCAAITVAVVAFVLGAVISAILAKLACRGKKGSCCKAGAKRPDGRFDPRNTTRKPRPPRFERRHPAPADGSVEIYVGNLSYETTEEALRVAFEAYGRVSNIRLITNRYNGKSKGFGFIQMPNRTEAEAAIAALNDKEIDGRKMKCNEARNLI